MRTFIAWMVACLFCHCCGAKAQNIARISNTQQQQQKPIWPLDQRFDLKFIAHQHDVNVDNKHRAHTHTQMVRCVCDAFEPLNKLNFIEKEFFVDARHREKWDSVKIVHAALCCFFILRFMSHARSTVMYLNNNNDRNKQKHTESHTPCGIRDASEECSWTRRSATDLWMWEKNQLHYNTE